MKTTITNPTLIRGRRNRKTTTLTLACDDGGEVDLVFHSLPKLDELGRDTQLCAMLLTSSRSRKGVEWLKVGLGKLPTPSDPSPLSPVNPQEELTHRASTRATTRAQVMATAEDLFGILWPGKTIRDLVDTTTAQDLPRRRRR